MRKEDKGGGMMERLTTNKDVSEMGMFELAHNSCYYKNGAARYRDFETDIDARELTRQLLKDYTYGDDAFVDDDDFDEEILELLMYGTSTTEGLIALFYRNMWAMADLRERLKEYEDLEEQGLLLRLPCKVGDTVYVKMASYCDIHYAEAEVGDFTHFTSCGFCIVVTSKHFDKQNIPFSEFGKTVFLTQAEAEQKLKEMNTDNGITE